MKFHTRKLVKPEDLNPNTTLLADDYLLGIDVVKFGNTSIILLCEVRKMMTKE